MTVHDKHAAHCYDYPRPALTVDIVVLRIVKEAEAKRYEVLLIQRGHHPFAGQWALPGGFVDRGESLEEAARRELNEETGLVVESMTQVGAFGDPGRDPRGWVVSVAYILELKNTGNDAVAGDDASSIKWWPVDCLPSLAFDHSKIVQAALQMLRRQ